MKNLILVLTLLTGLFVMSCNTNSSQKDFKAEKENLSVQEASKLLSESALLIDVREPDEVVEQAYDVKEIKNIPLGELENHLTEIPKNKLVILACRAGGRSAKAFDLLKSRGFINIANMEGGMNAWEAAGLPIKAADVSSDSLSVSKTSCVPDPSGKCKEGSKSCCSMPDAKVAITKGSSKNHLEVYAFHGTRQCETCKNMKANTKAALDEYFSVQLKSGAIVFSIIDVDVEKNATLAEKFQATGTALMVNNVINGKDNISDWSNFAFEKANDAKQFIPELKILIEDELKKQNGNSSSIN